MEQVLSSNKPKKNEQISSALLTTSKEKNFIFASVFFAFLIRIFFIPHNTVINGDGIYYATLGKRLFSGDISGGISGYWSPLYSSLVGISSLFFHDSEFAGRLVSVIAGTLLIIPAYYLIRNFYGRMPAYLGTVLIAIHPALLVSSGWVMTEAVYTLIFTTVILVGWYALRSGNARTFFITGLLWGAAYLTKPEALGFLVLLFILTTAAKFFRRNISFRRYAAGYLLLLTGFMIFFLPYVIFLRQKTGQWTISQKIMVNLPAFDYDKGLLNITDDGQITMQDRIWGDIYETEAPQTVAPPTPAEPASSPAFSWSKLQSDVTILGAKALFLFKKQLRDYIPALLPYPFILLAIIGFFYKPWTGFRAARELYLFSFFLCMLIGYALSAVELRYIYPLIPILIAWVAKGIVEFGDWTSKSLTNLLGTSRRIKPLLVQICVLIIFAALLTPSILSQNKAGTFQNTPFEEKQAGLWIKNQGTSPTLVMSSNATPAYYAGAKHLYLPAEEFLTVLEYAKRKKVNYLVYSLRRIKTTSKSFPPDEKNVPPELRLVYQDEPSPNYRIIVYQIVY